MNHKNISIKNNILVKSRVSLNLWRSVYYTQSVVEHPNIILRTTYHRSKIFGTCMSVNKDISSVSQLQLGLIHISPQSCYTDFDILLAYSNLRAFGNINLSTTTNDILMVVGMQVHNSKYISFSRIAYALEIVLLRLIHFTCISDNINLTTICHLVCRCTMTNVSQLLDDLCICPCSHTSLTLLHFVSMCRTGETFIANSC